MKRFFVGITGASGSLYGLKIVDEIAKDQSREVFLSVTDDGFENIMLETGIKDFENVKLRYFSRNNIKLLNHKDFSSSVASGSFKIDSYIIAPASMGCVGRIASGVSSNLIERCADVALKERRKLVVLFREAPLNNIHLENLLKISTAGGVIFPASPGFYHNPSKVDDLINFIVGKVFDIINLEHELFKRWGNKEDA